VASGPCRVLLRLANVVRRQGERRGANAERARALAALTVPLDGGIHRHVILDVLYAACDVDHRLDVGNCKRRKTMT